MDRLSTQDQAGAFIRYATSGTLDEDETYTVELLVDSARMSYDPNYWDDWQKRDDARETSGYKPGFDAANSVRPLPISIRAPESACSASAPRSAPFDRSRPSVFSPISNS